MFRKLLSAAMIFSALAMAACSNSSSSKDGGGVTQQGCPANANNNQTIGAQPTPVFPGHADAFPPGLPGNGPAPQQPQPGPQQPAQGNQPCQALAGKWMGQENLSQDGGVDAKIQLEFNGATMKATTICTAGGEQAMASVTVQVGMNGNKLTVATGAKTGATFRGVQDGCMVNIPAGTSTFEVNEPTLTITFDDGNVLHFNRVGQPPQQGTPVQNPGPGQPNQPNQPGQGQQGVLGRWSTGELSQDPNLSAHMILYISQGQMTAMAACIDKQTQQQVQAMVTVPVTIDSHTINIQQDANDSKPIGGQECSINIPAGPFDYTLRGNQMTINTRNSQLEFTRF